MTVEMQDHREIRTDISVGGTSRLFELEATSRYGFSARVADNRGDMAEVDALYSGESLFRVIYRNGTEVVYDYSGNLAKLTLNVAKAYADMSDEVLSELDQSVVAAAQTLVRYQSELVIEVDLRDGLVLGDMSGWSQMIADKNLIKVSQDIGGAEVVSGKGTLLHQIKVRDDQGELVGMVYVTVSLVGGQLKIGVGDENLMQVTRYRRLMNPELVNMAKTPIGALNLLTSLVEQTS